MQHGALLATNSLISYFGSGIKDHYRRREKKKQQQNFAQFNSTVRQRDDFLKREKFPNINKSVTYENGKAEN